jgi:hypothetical protein
MISATPLEIINTREETLKPVYVMCSATSEWTVWIYWDESFVLTMAAM